MIQFTKRLYMVFLFEWKRVSHITSYNTVHGTITVYEYDAIGYV